MTKFNTIGALALAGVAAIGVAGPAHAATATSTFTVNATVLKACIVTALPLNFGTYDPTSTTPTDGTTTVSVLCTTGTSYTTGLNAGAGSSVTARRMSNGADLLNYALFQETGRTNNWGNTPGTDTPAAVTAGVGITNRTVFGRIPAGQNVPLGAYTDTVTVTVTY